MHRLRSGLTRGPDGAVPLTRYRTRIAIIGGGIGGLVMALQCHQRGLDCLVFEAAQRIEPLGVGINLLPHSVRILSQLGLLEPLAQTAVETAELAFFNKHGQLIWREPRGIAAGYDYPQFSVHRGELQMLLLREVERQLGRSHILMGHALTRFDIGNGTTPARAEFENRQSGERIAEVVADVVIAADGIHSTVRTRLYPDEGLPRYSGRILWRGTCIAPPFLTGRSMIQAGHARQKAVVYPISHGALERSGLNLTNWIMERQVPGGTPPRQDWSKRVDKSVFADAFASWRWDWLDIHELITNGSDAYEYPMCDRDPLDRWSFGRITLLGDAAHPMYPIGSNGASQAILDTESLADALLACDQVEVALARYEAERREVTGRIVLANRENGPDQVMQLAEERAPHGFSDVHEVISLAELESIAARYKQTAGFSRQQVNGPLNKDVKTP